MGAKQVGAVVLLERIRPSLLHLLGEDQFLDRPLGRNFVEKVFRVAPFVDGVAGGRGGEPLRPSCSDSLPARTE